MKKLIIFVLTILTVGALFTASADHLGLVDAPSGAVLTARHSVVSIVKWDDEENAWVRYCSGAVVALPQGPRIVTAGHCILGRSTSRTAVRDYDGNIYPITIESVNWSGRLSITDNAVLRSSAAYLLPALTVADSTPEIGDTAWGWSSPLGLAPLLIRGFYAGKYDPNGESELDGMPMIIGIADGGSSGTILLNDDGEAFGILVIGFTTAVKFSAFLWSNLPG